MRLYLWAALFAAPAAFAQTAPATVDTPVLARSFERGESLSVSDFETRPMLPGAARGALKPEDAAGKETSRRLMAGATVRAGDVALPQLVRRGEAVIVSVRSGPLSITTSGKALSGGGIGDPVRVVSFDTSRTLTAIVEARGQVRVAGNWEVR